MNLLTEKWRDSVYKKALFLVVGVCVVSLICGFIDYKKINKLADKARAKDMMTGECFDSENFIFGDTACVERDDESKETFIAYRVSNSIYSEVRIDFNKSRIIGDYLGRKSVQFMKGFVFGQKKKSKHDD